MSTTRSIRFFVGFAIAWATVIAFILFGKLWLGELGSMLKSAALFLWLFAVIICAFSVVTEADHLAELLGEPLGTLVLNGVVGLALFLGGLRHREQAYNFQGAVAYLSVIAPLSVIALILPKFKISGPNDALTKTQSFFFSLFTLLLYAVFLAVQTVRHRNFFVEPSLEVASGESVESNPVHGRSTGRDVGRHTLLLILLILPIVLLAKQLAKLLDCGITMLHAPPAIGGVLIALIIFTPEGMSALRAALQNQLQRAVNLCLGSTASTIGLTVPAVVAIGLLTGQPVVLGIDNASTVLLATTLLLSVITFCGPRTTVLEGTVHLVMFGVYIVLIFSP
jgi:Ca2+:H+ antiporter